MNCDQVNPPEERDDERTLIYGRGNESLLSAEELRAALGVPSGERIEDYQGLSAIGIGGVGAVFSAHEPGLNREVALKILRPQFRDQADRIESFIREARATAQIDHPNIVPVHRLGVFDDVGVYFTMKRVEGETLRAILRKLSENREGYRRNYSLNRLLEIFVAACNGVAFAHRHGILHCDLKPGNLMVGDYGEVLVMDWGMARYRADLDQGGCGGAKMDLELGCRLDAAPENDPEKLTLGGTPAFMPPEMITGEQREADEQADVYGLGAILYTILTWKSAPYDVTLPPEELMRIAATGRFVPPRKAAPREQSTPLELEAICLKAMARDRSKRYATVAELLQDLRNYMDDYPVQAYSPTPFYRLAKLIRRRPMIPATLAAAILTWAGFYGYGYLSNLSQGNSLLTLAEYNYTQAGRHNAVAQRIRQQLLHDTSPRDDRTDAFREEELRRQTAEAENGYNSALEFISRAAEYGVRESVVNRMYRDVFSSMIRLYLQTDNYGALESFLRQVRGRWKQIFDRVVEEDPALGTLVRRFQERSGTLEITAPAQAGRRLSIYDDQGQIVMFPGQAPGDSGYPAEDLPLGDERHQFELPAGSYRLEFNRPGHATVRAPVIVPPAGVGKLHWNIPDELPPDVCFIPGGEFLAGRRGGRKQLPAFLIGRHEVTFREYLDFWRSLGDPALRTRYLGWSSLQADGGRGAPEPIWDEQGRLRDPFRPEFPVVGIPGEATEAFCRYKGWQLGMNCRLPSQLEWEKAARGVDGRDYVWGNIYVSDRALLADHPEARLFPSGAQPESFPADVSPYGVYDLVGNVRELVRSPGESGVFYLVLGGSSQTPPVLAGSSNAYYVNGGADDLGFRYVLELPSPAADGE